MIGVASYLLINFWWTRIQANKASILAFTMNRVGDMGLSIGFLAIFALFGSLDYATVFNLVPFMNETAITIIGLLLLTGAMAKSAQIPLHSWLPGSMEGWTNPKKINFLYFTFLIYYLVLLYQHFIIVDFYIFYKHFDFISMIKISVLPIFLGRDHKGRFIGKNLPLVPLPDKLQKAMMGELLGDGHLRFNKKGINGLPKPNTNAQFAITLKSKEHVMFLWQDIYSAICSKNPPYPWPNPKTGKPVSQYHFASRALVSLTEVHKQWYIFNKENNKFIKIVPLNIGELLTPIGLAHWIMGDGYWDTYNKTIDICTDNFTLSEVELLISVLKEHFDLLATTKRRIKSNKVVCWRIRFSGKSENLSKLRYLVEPYFIPSMLYKLNISTAPEPFPIIP